MTERSRGRTGSASRESDEVEDFEQHGIGGGHVYLHETSVQGRDPCRRLESVTVIGLSSDGRGSNYWR